MKQQRQLKSPYLVSVVLCAMLGLSSCADEKDLYDPNYETENPLESLSAPENFDWKTTATMVVKVDVAETTGGSPCQIEVFTSNPVSNTSVKALTAGYARKGLSFISTITVSKAVNYIFIRQTSPEGLSSVRSFAVEDGKNVACDFGTATPVPETRSMTRAIAIPTPEEPTVTDDMFPTNAPAGATVITGTGWYGGGSSLESPKPYIINATTTVLGQVGQYTEMYVTENATISAYGGRKGHTIYILPGKTLTFTGDFDFSTQNGRIFIGENASLVVNGKLETANNNKIYNRSNLQVTSLVSKGATLLYNQGNISSDYIELGTGGVKLFNYNNVTCNNLKATGSAHVYNYAEVAVTADTNIASPNVWYNSGTWTTNTFQTISKKAVFYNGCKLIVTDKLSLNQARFINDAGSYILAKNMETVNTRIDMYDASFINVTDVAYAKGSRIAENEGIYGVGANKRSLLRMVKMTTDIADSQHMYFSGNLQVACDDYPSQYANGSNAIWVMANGAEWASENNTVSIPESECSGGWNPTPGPVDPIGPVVDPNSYTYAFEDYWPLYGDYDMNDAVIRVNEITAYTNKDNQTEKLDFKVSVRAVGAEKRIAGALMLDKVKPNQVKSVTYSNNTPTTFSVNSGVENNQNNAVIPLFDELHKFMGDPIASYINTNKASSSNVANPPILTVTIEFSTPMNVADLGAKYFNVFIITDINKIPVTSSQRKEIHLLGYEPTELANKVLFGNNSDNSIVSGIYYKSKDNLPWGIMFATEDSPFKWPLEHVNIKDAYLGFTDWVESGGGQEDTWWKTPVLSKVYEE